MIKLGVNERCSLNDLCNDLVGLLCQDGICKCGITSFWKDIKCGKYKKETLR